MKLRVTVGGRELTVELPDLPGQPVRIDGSAVSADLRPIGPALYSVLLDGRSHEVALEGGEPARADVDGAPLDIIVEDERRQVPSAGAGASAAGGSGKATIAAPMPGRVVAVPVAVGDEVAKGQTVVVLEAMKMESALATSQAGRVVEVLVTPGETVQQRQALVRVDG